MNNGKRLPALTALKGIFIWMIVLHNTLSVDPLFDYIPGVSFLRIFGGSLGNGMFLILSGFLMSFGYRERITEGRITFGDFLLRRLRKLYPLYALSNAAAVLVEIWQYGISSVNLRRIVFTFLMQQGGGLDSQMPYNAPSWFAASVIFCYILYYAGTCRMKTPTAYRVFLTVMVVIGYTLNMAQLNLPFVNYGNGIAIMNFFIGCILAEIYPLLDRYSRWLKPAAMAVLAGSFYLMLAYGVELISGGSVVTFAFLICPLVLYLAYAPGLCERILCFRPLQWLGSVSMGTFYWHLVLYFAMRKAMGGMTEVFYGVYLVAVLAASVLTHILQQRKRR